MIPRVSRLVRHLLERSIERSPRFRGMIAGLLGHHLTSLDLDFLRALPDGVTVDLDRQLELERGEPGMPSVLWSVLWEASAARALGERCPKRVLFHLRGRQFVMELDLAESPECGYLLRNPTVKLTQLLLRGGETMLDIGANAGFHALTAGLFFQRVIAFEPTPATAERLERNIGLSGFAHVQSRRVALSNRIGQTTFHVESGHCGSNRIGEGGGPASITVPLQTLDALASTGAPLGRIDFIKIDVEGHECEVLEGAQSTIERDRPRLFVEFNTAAQFDRFQSLLPSGYVPLEPRIDGTSSPITSGAAAVAARDVLFEMP